MKITITGSLGNVSKPLATLLILQGHQVTIVSSDPGKAAAIAALGAQAAIGSIADNNFLCSAFAGADAVYAMIPLSYTAADPLEQMRQMADSYVQAIRQAAVPRVVLLSGWAADLTREGSLESSFDQLSGVALSILRPASFYTNFYFSMELIRGKGLPGKLLALQHYGLGALLRGRTGLLMGNFGGDDRVVFVSPKDIAAAAAEELLRTDHQRTIRYLGSEEMTCNEAARIIGNAIGKPWLKWVLLSDKQMLRGLKMAKMPPSMAQIMVEMQAATHQGKTLANFHRHYHTMGQVKLADFAKEFAAVYHGKSL